MKKIHLNAVAAALACGVSLGSAVAQSGGTTPGGSGPSVSTTVPARPLTLPAAQPGAGTRNSPAAANAGKLDRSDRNFMVKAAEEGMFEVEIAKLGAGKATNPEIRSFATMMVDDHTKANSELMQLATAKGVELPAGPPRGKRRELEKMAKLSGDKFDREFAKEVGVDDHQKNIKMFEKASKDAKDPELKAWIDKTLPSLRSHLADAARLPPNARKGKG